MTGRGQILNVLQRCLGIHVPASETGCPRAPRSAERRALGFVQCLSDDRQHGDDRPRALVTQPHAPSHLHPARRDACVPRFCPCSRMSPLQPSALDLRKGLFSPTRQCAQTLFQCLLWFFVFISVPSC